MVVAITGPAAWKTAAALLLAVLPVNLKNNAGKSIRGELVGFTESSVQLDLAGETVEFDFDELAQLRPLDAEERSGPKYRVTLVNGSRIAAIDVRLDGQELVIEPRRQNRLRVPVKQVKAIRFRPASVATDAQWLGNLDRQARGDTLVIRRPGDRLDPQQGVIVSIGDGKVRFDFDEQIIDAPIDRLEGVILGGTGGVLEQAEIQVTDIYQSKWAVSMIQPSKGDQPLQMRLDAGIQHELPLHQILSIRFSGGYTMLADEKPAESSVRTYLKTRVNDQLIDDFFGPTRNGDSDLVMYGGSSIEYRIESGHQTFAGTARRDAGVAKGGSVIVRIELDGETVWKEQLDDGQPRGFELPVETSRRLAIHVESGGDGDLGDTVRISRPRLLK